MSQQFLPGKLFSFLPPTIVITFIRNLWNKVNGRSIIKIPANRVFFSTPNAEIIPITIGTIQATRAVVEGTKKLRANPVKITPIRIRFVFAPTKERTRRAIRLSSPVFVIAMERNNAAPTRAQAVLANPLRPLAKAALVPYMTVGFATLGAKPRRIIIKERIIAALAGYETHSVIHRITEKTKRASMWWPATGRTSFPWTWTA